MGRNGRLIGILILLAMLTAPALAVNLSFSNGTAVTLIPTTVGQYYDEIDSSNLSWVVIGGIVPKPLVDIFGGGEFGWRIVWFSTFAVLFVVMFARQKNVFIPMMVAWIVMFFIINRVPQELKFMFFVLPAASLIGVFFYLAITKE